jgi:hypothetical protein
MMMRDSTGDTLSAFPVDGLTQVMQEWLTRMGTFKSWRGRTILLTWLRIGLVQVVVSDLERDIPTTDMVFDTGAIEQAILSHPEVVEASVVGIPDALKGHLPFAFIQPRTASTSLQTTPTPELFKAINQLVREQIGAVASLGGMIQGRGMIPKTRSGKTLRRVLRELVEHGVRGEYGAPVNIPPTVEDADVVEVARGKVREYFEQKQHRKVKL